jgi:hypothetical protein
MSLQQQVLDAINQQPLAPAQQPQQQLQQQLTLQQQAQAARRGPPISLPQLHAIAAVQASLQSALVKGLSQRLNSSNISSKAFQIFKQDAKTVHLQVRGCVASAAVWLGAR